MKLEKFHSFQTDIEELQNFAGGLPMFSGTGRVAGGVIQAIGGIDIA